MVRSREKEDALGDEEEKGVCKRWKGDKRGRKKMLEKNVKKITDKRK